MIEIKNLCKYYPVRGGSNVHAVDQVSLSIKEGETLGLVGESGSGKSTLGRLLAGLETPTKGEMSYLPQARAARAKTVQMIFQDPYGSLNPRMTVGDIIAEGPDILKLWTKEERKTKILEWLKKVGLKSEHAERFPHEFSGGQRQRIGLARALAVNPRFIVLDEPISALDVSIQAQIVNLLQDLQKEFGLTYLFIAHGLSMVRFISDRIAVMYLGQIVEIGQESSVYQTPAHPYTQALIAANPSTDPAIEQTKHLTLLTGEISSPIDPKPGCRFVARCPHAMDLCHTKEPEMKLIAPGHSAKCHKV